jgi:hypothetical protein
MRRTLTDDGASSEFEQQFRLVQRSAWRWEQQPVYEIGFEQANVEAFLAGNPVDPMTVEGLAYWFRQVAEQTSRGITISRVRILEEPPTPYQRWEKWLDRWNTGAGERIDYLNRSQLAKLGAPAFAPTADWWLFDDEQLMVMHHDEVGHRIRVELFLGEPENETALQWRDKLITAAQSGMF